MRNACRIRDVHNILPLISMFWNSQSFTVQSSPATLISPLNWALITQGTRPFIPLKLILRQVFARVGNTYFPVKSRKDYHGILDFLLILQFPVALVLLKILH